MKLLKFEDLEFVISDRSWERIEKRFNLGNTEDVGVVGNQYKINKPCMCDLYNECVGCPFTYLDNNYEEGCFVFLAYYMFEDQEILFKHNNTGFIRWHEENDVEARTQIKKVYDFIISAKDISKAEVRQARKRIKDQYA